LRVAIKLNNIDLIKSTFESCSDLLVKKQLAFILARSRIYLTDLPEEINSIVSNLKTSDFFKKLARELDVVEPKNPEDIFHLEEKKTIEPIDSYKLNLASSIVSSFVNAGFGKENLLSKAGSDWINRNKDEGLICTLAGLGLVNLWDIECGPNELEKFMGSNETDPFKKAGYNLGLGIISSGVRDENEVASAVLTEQLNDKKYKI
jgi:26S proteasome regulatory subunit N1